MYMQSENLVVDDEMFQEFCENRGIKDTTVEVYRGCLQKYVNFTGMTLGELLDEADEEEESAIRLRKRKIKTHLMDFKKHLDTTDLAESTKDYTLKLVRSFYNEYDIQLPKNIRRNKRSDSKQDLLFEDLPTMQDIKDFLEYVKPPYKAITLLCVSSGMSRSEITSLTFKHFYDSIPLDPYPETMNELIRKIKDLDNIIPLWKIKRVKTNKNYFTFCSPEALDKILAYLIWFQRKFPDYQPKPSDKLFRTKYNEPLKNFSVSEMYRKANERAGFETGKNNVAFITPHSLRRVFASTLERNKMPHLMTRWLMGHKLDSTTSAYFKADPEAIKEEYIQFISHLTVNQNVEVKTVTTEGYDQLLKDSKEKREKIKSMEKEIEEMKEKNKERDKLLDEIIHDKKVMGNILK